MILSDLSNSCEYFNATTGSPRHKAIYAPADWMEPKRESLCGVLMGVWEGEQSIVSLLSNKTALRTHNEPNSRLGIGMDAETASQL